MVEAERVGWNSDACQIFGIGHLYFELSLYKKGATKSYTNQNFDSQDDANIEEVHDHSATETRFSHIAGAEGDKGSKRCNFHKATETRFSHSATETRFRHIASLIP
ncbi:hypothetical protein GQ457_14G025260 [Hibiscus cannabinus]